MDSYLELCVLTSTYQNIAPGIMYAMGQQNKLYDKLAAAKAADPLIAMICVEAVFVITRQDEEVIGISARSSGKVNVQKIMEALGGGGHFTNAATKILGESLEKVEEMLLNEVKQIEIE